jgi:hypothetical protein
MSWQVLAQDFFLARQASKTAVNMSSKFFQFAYEALSENKKITGVQKVIVGLEIVDELTHSFLGESLIETEKEKAERLEAAGKVFTEIHKLHKSKKICKQCHRPFTKYLINGRCKECNSKYLKEKAEKLAGSKVADFLFSLVKGGN